MLIAMHARVGAAPSSVLSPVSPRQAYCRRIKRCTVVAKADDTPDVSSQPTDLDAQLLEDLQRLKAKEASQRAQQPAYPEASTAQTGGSLAGAKELIDKILIADFFFILLVLSWLAAGVGERATLGSSALLDAWFPLWDLVFQPAIGVLMLGAIVSGTVGWLKNRS